MVGINYWDTDMSEDHPEGEDKEHLVQFMFGLIGVSFHWW